MGDRHGGEMEDRAFEALCASIINTNWKYSWHWVERYASGMLSNEGWDHVLRDCKSELQDAMVKVEQLTAIRDALRGVISRDAALTRIREAEKRLRLVIELDNG